MSRLATLGPEILGKAKTKAPEAFRTITYRQGDTDTPDIDAVPDKLKFGEADGQFIKITDAVWLIFKHQLPVEPHADDWIIDAKGVEHFVIKASAEDPANILWRVITKA